MRGSSHAPFGKRPTEKDPATGTSPAVDFTLRAAGVRFPRPLTAGYLPIQRNDVYEVLAHHADAEAHPADGTSSRKLTRREREVFELVRPTGLSSSGKRMNTTVDAACQVVLNVLAALTWSQFLCHGAGCGEPQYLRLPQPVLAGRVTVTIEQRARRARIHMWNPEFVPDDGYLPDTGVNRRSRLHRSGPASGRWARSGQYDRDPCCGHASDNQPNRHIGTSRSREPVAVTVRSANSATHPPPGRSRFPERRRPSDWVSPKW